MHFEIRQPTVAEGIGARISPDICPVAAMLAKSEIVDVFAAAVFPNQDQFMLVAVKGAHPSIGLVPDNQVLELTIGPPPGSEHFVEMAPIRADKVDGTILRMFGQLTK